MLVEHADHLSGPLLLFDEGAVLVLLLERVMCSAEQAVRRRFPSNIGSYAWMSEESGAKAYSSEPSEIAIPNLAWVSPASAGEGNASLARRCEAPGFSAPGW
jgi:hypothetical protein